VDVVGGMHAFDVSDVQHDGSRKSANFYGAPAGLCKDLRGHTDVWPPMAYFPSWKHPDTEAGRSRWRALMRECLCIMFSCYDGNTFISWRAPSGEERLGLLAFNSLVVDGADYPWLVNNRGPKGLFGCGRCCIPTSLIHSNVTPLSRCLALRRTYNGEVVALRYARSLRTAKARNHSLQLAGLQADAVDNPLYRFAGSLKSRNWVIARLLPIEPLHTIEAGVAAQVELAIVQLPQRLHEAIGEQASAVSPAAAFADRVLRQSARELYEIVAAVPPGRRHSTWPVNTTTRLITRHRGKQKPPLPRIEFRFCNGWHYRDLGRVMAVWVLQPHFFGGSMHGPVATPRHEVTDFFGTWEQRTASEGSTFVSQCLSVNLFELACLVAEVFCLLVSWYNLFLIVRLSERQLQELRILDEEFHEASKAILAFKATWKKHQMEEAPESRMDLGDHVSAQSSEAAHKLTKLLFRLGSNRSLTDFTAQLAQARNRVVAAQLLRRQYEAGLKPQVNEPTPPSTRQTESTLLQPDRSCTLQLVVDQRRRVTSLLSSCGLAQQNQEMLLEEQGYAHLFWAILNYLNDSADAQLVEDGRDWPLLTLSVHSSIAIGQTGCPRAAAAHKISLEPFTNVPTRAFVRVDAGDGVSWFGRPIFFGTVTTMAKEKYEVVYCKWLDFALSGTERLKLPLPVTFPLHQWAKTHMGLPPLGGHVQQASDSYGIVDASKVKNWEPIAPIGLRTWRPTSEYLQAGRARGGRACGGRARGGRGRNQREREPSGVGEPLFANNVHVWSF